MTFKVTANEISLQDEQELNKGEYNVHNCVFEFSDEYNDLVKKALFTNAFGNTYIVEITDDKCDIPYEVLTSTGAITLGVIGYTVKENILEKRYSPKPIAFSISQGSYVEDVENSRIPTPTEIEQLSNKVSELENKVGKSVLNANDIVDDLTSESADKVLSANQGRILNESISETNSTIETISSNVEENSNEIASINVLLPNKADKSELDSYYNKTQTDEQITNAISGKADKTEIPDVSNFITKTVSDLENYYLKTETYTQDEVNALISAIPKFAIQVVETLPTENISDTTVYLVTTGTETQNLYTEYIYVNSAWEKLGTQSVDLTDYYTKEETTTQISNAIADLTTKTYVDSAITTAINGITNGDEVTY